MRGARLAYPRASKSCRGGDSNPHGGNPQGILSREPYLSEARAIEGPTMVLTDSEKLCAFGRFFDPNGQVWNQLERSDDPAIREMSIRQVENCPAGRLIAWDKETKKPIEPELPISIGLIEDPAQQCSGPIWLRGGIPVVSADGFEYEVRNRVTLCRCGQSQNKPFATALMRKRNSRTHSAMSVAARIARARTCGEGSNDLRIDRTRKIDNALPLLAGQNAAESFWRLCRRRRIGIVKVC
jgi:CDGSH-type Zn-finger protein